MTSLRIFLVAGLLALLAGCASGPPAPSAPERLPAEWAGPLPHGGDPRALGDWWMRLGDEALPALVAQAQADSPTLAQAAARIAQARAAARASRAGLWPSLDLGLGLQRERAPGLVPGGGEITSTTGRAGVDAAWELDLFGARRASVNAAQARVEAGALQWHEARISLAAEVAQALVSLRACEALAGVLSQEAQSQGRIAELTRQKVRVGFESPSNGALAEAGAADSASRLVAQQAECEVLRQSLVLLTGLPHPALVARLAGGTARLPQPAAFEVRSVPAEVLAQRPDVGAAQRAVAAAAAEVGSAQAQQWPALRLAGSIAALVTEVAGVRTHASTWSIGPALGVPLFDGGLRAANLEAARGRYDEARAQFEQQARLAVREVEEALVRLDAATRRGADAERAASGYREFFRAAEQRWQVGAGSLIEMEDARRLALNAEAALVGVQRERVAAWIALYKAVGGGWDGHAAGPAAPSTPPVPGTTPQDPA